MIDLFVHDFIISLTILMLPADTNAVGNALSKQETHEQAELDHSQCASRFDFATIYVLLLHGYPRRNLLGDVREGS